MIVPKTGVFTYIVAQVVEFCNFVISVDVLNLVLGFMINTN